jgi:hypothetical protein
MALSVFRRGTEQRSAADVRGDQAAAKAPAIAARAARRGGTGIRPPVPAKPTRTF